MSIITDFLNLFKYDPETDGASTFNIKQCLNDNWDKIDAWASGIKTTIAGLVPGTRKINNKELSADVTLTAMDIGAVDSDTVGQPGGVATLDSTGKVPSGQLPSMDYIPTSQKGAASGVASLDSSGQLEASQKPDYTASEVGAVPTTRTVNGKALSADVTLTGDDIPTSASDSTSISSQLSNKANSDTTLSIRKTLTASDDLAELLPGTYTLNGGLKYSWFPPEATGDHWAVLIKFNQGSMYLLRQDRSQNNYIESRYWMSENGENWNRIETELMATTPPTVRNLTLQSGFVVENGCVYWKTQENIVTIMGGVWHNTGNLQIDQNTQIGTLIAGYYPINKVRCSAVTASGSAYVEVHTDGTVWIHPFASDNRCWFFIQYEVAT